MKKWEKSEKTHFRMQQVLVLADVEQLLSFNYTGSVKLYIICDYYLTG